MSNQSDSAGIPPARREKNSGELDLKQHRNRCAVCKHPDRAGIEDAFLRWCSVSDIVREFNLSARDSVYRHARAFGLFARRSGNLRFALAHIIEEARSVPVTAHAVIDAVRAYARIDGDGHWVQPSRKLTVVHKNKPSPHQFRPSRREGSFATQAETKNDSTR